MAENPSTKSPSKRRQPRLSLEQLKVAFLAADSGRLAACQEIERLRKALQFYADPFSARDEHGDLVTVPDFYSELDFGSTARAALTDGDA